MNIQLAKFCENLANWSSTDLNLFFENASIYSSTIANKLVDKIFETEINPQIISYKPLLDEFGKDEPFNIIPKHKKLKKRKPTLKLYVDDDKHLENDIDLIWPDRYITYKKPFLSLDSVPINHYEPPIIPKFVCKQEVCGNIFDKERQSALRRRPHVEKNRFTKYKPKDSQQLIQHSDPDNSLKELINSIDSVITNKSFTVSNQTIAIQSWKNKVWDIIWLELQAWFFDRSLTQMDHYVCQLRVKFSSIIIQCCNLRLSPMCDFNSLHHMPGSQMVDLSFPNILQTIHIDLLAIHSNKVKVLELLEAIYKFESLFPHTRWISPRFPKYKSKKFVVRLKTLNLWVNLNRIIAYKLNALGQIFQISNPKVWPYLKTLFDSPYVGDQNVDFNTAPFASYRPLSETLFKSYVENAIRDGTLAKLIFQLINLLHLPLRKLASALTPSSNLYCSNFVDGSKQSQCLPTAELGSLTLDERYLEESNSQKTCIFPSIHAFIPMLDVKYGCQSETTTLSSQTAPKHHNNLVCQRYGVHSNEYLSMNLVSFVNCYLFLVRIPIEIVHQWLRIRLEQKPLKVSVLSAKQLMKECKEVIKASLLVRHYYTEFVLKIYEKNTNVNLQLNHFNHDLWLMFDLYVEYLEQAIELSYQTNGLWDQIECLQTEWNFIEKIGPYLGPIDTNKLPILRVIKILIGFNNYQCSQLSSYTKSFKNPGLNNIPLLLSTEMRSKINFFKEKITKFLHFTKNLINQFEITARYTTSAQTQHAMQILSILRENNYVLLNIRLLKHSQPQNRSLYPLNNPVKISVLKSNHNNNNMNMMNTTPIINDTKNNANIPHKKLAGLGSKRMFSFKGGIKQPSIKYGMDGVKLRHKNVILTRSGSKKGLLMHPTPNERVKSSDISQLKLPISDAWHDLDSSDFETNNDNFSNENVNTMHGNCFIFAPHSIAKNGRLLAQLLSYQSGQNFNTSGINELNSTNTLNKNNKYKNCFDTNVLNDLFSFLLSINFTPIISADTWQGATYNVEVNHEIWNTLHRANEYDTKNIDTQITLISTSANLLGKQRRVVEKMFGPIQELLECRREQTSSVPIIEEAFKQLKNCIICHLLPCITNLTQCAIDEISPLDVSQTLCLQQIFSLGFDAHRDSIKAFIPCIQSFNQSNQSNSIVKQDDITTELRKYCLGYAKLWAYYVKTYREPGHRTSRWAHQGIAYIKFASHPEIFKVIRDSNERREILEVVGTALRHLSNARSQSSNNTSHHNPYAIKTTDNNESSSTHSFNHGSNVMEQSYYSLSGSEHCDPWIDHTSQDKNGIISEGLDNTPPHLLRRNMSWPVKMHPSLVEKTDIQQINNYATDIDKAPSRLFSNAISIDPSMVNGNGNEDIDDETIVEFKHFKICQKTSQIDQIRQTKLAQDGVIGRVVVEEPRETDSFTNILATCSQQTSNNNDDWWLNGYHYEYSRRASKFRWQRGMKIGQGQTGKVYTAINMDTGELMALKEITLHPSVKEHHFNMIQDVIDEIRMFESIRHPNMVRYYGVQVHRFELFIFMEYCSGGTLEQQARNAFNENSLTSCSGLNEYLVRRYTWELLLALNHLHSMGIVHRDIKGANIYMTQTCDYLNTRNNYDLTNALYNDEKYEPSLKLGDFGCAEKLRSLNNSLNCQKQPTNSDDLFCLVGTPAFMAPEVINRANKLETVSAAVDIWSLGCVVFQMVTGKAPWHECENMFQIMFKVGSGARPCIKTSLPTSLVTSNTNRDYQNDELNDFLDACFKVDPKERWTAGQLLEHPFTKGGKL